MEGGVLIGVLYYSMIYYHWLVNNYLGPRMISKYGIVAVQAANAAGNGMHPLDAWNYSSATIFDSPSSISKNCPKSTFLGLAELGVISGIKPGEYTKSIENKKYAELALKLLRENSSWSDNPSKLWEKIMDGTAKKHNSQMDVVTALWQAKLFIK